VEEEGLNRARQWGNTGQKNDRLANSWLVVAFVFVAVAVVVVFWVCVGERVCEVPDWYQVPGMVICGCSDVCCSGGLLFAYSRARMWRRRAACWTKVVLLCCFRADDGSAENVGCGRSGWVGGVYCGAVGDDGGKMVARWRRG
jgi:hypothetical protein